MTDVYSVVSVFVSDPEGLTVDAASRVTQAVVRAVSVTTGTLREAPRLYSERDEFRRGWRLTGTATACLGRTAR